MKWPQLAGKKRQQPTTGQWHDWKQSIADECGTQCIYCAIPESRFGGIRNFHIEHYRPKSKFPKLENEIGNLYLACAICNVLKCDDWPADPIADHSISAYPDPAVCDYNLIFHVNATNYKAESNTAAGKYVIERIMLNRAQLILQRRLSALLNLVNEFEGWCGQDNMRQLDATELREVIGILQSICRLESSVLAARPYRDEQTHRPTASKAKRKRSP